LRIRVRLGCANGETQQSCTIADVHHRLLFRPGRVDAAGITKGRETESPYGPDSK